MKLCAEFPTKVCSSIAQAADRPYSHVVVTTKAIPELSRTSTLLSPFLSPPYSDTYPQPTYVLLQNGLNVELDLYDAIKKLGKSDPKIISAAVHIGTNLVSDNIVEHNEFVRIKRDISVHQQTDSKYRIESFLEFTDRVVLSQPTLPPRKHS
jgi:2-dehydropantoate 2-reductase